MKEFFLVVVGRGFITSDFLTFLALVEDDVSAGFDLQTNGFHQALTG
jgi:hypothetical protein